MPHTLKLHPDSHCLAATGIEVEVARGRDGGLDFSYELTGTIGDLRLPAAAASGRADDLWRHTCFEVFVGGVDGAGYYELNFSPSTQWAAYWFSDYRHGMRRATEVGAPRIAVQIDAERYVLRAALQPAQFTRLRGDGEWRLGLAAVIEEMNGEISYWALAHPEGKADFHHGDGFVLQFAPAARA